jgi:hypothetical protein
MSVGVMMHLVVISFFAIHCASRIWLIGKSGYLLFSDAHHEYSESILQETAMFLC